MNILLKQKLNSLLSDSKVFKLMSEGDQASIIAGFETASDDQLAQAISVLEAREKEFNENEQGRLAAAQAQISAAETLHQEIKATEKIALAIDEEADQADSLLQLQQMESEIGISKNKPVQPAPKKFLGLF